MKLSKKPKSSVLSRVINPALVSVALSTTGCMESEVVGLPNQPDQEIFIGESPEIDMTRTIPIDVGLPDQPDQEIFIGVGPEIDMQVPDEADQEIFIGESPEEQDFEAVGLIASDMGLEPGGEEMFDPDAAVTGGN